MYRAVVVQKVLQRRQEPWRWAQWSAIRGSKLILLQLREKLPKNSALTILWSFSIWSKLERWKTLVSGCLVIWPQIKIIILKCHLLLFYAATMNHFLTGLCRAMKSRFYMTTRDNQLTGWTKKKLQITSQSQTCTKKGSQSLSGSLLPVWSTTPFWIPVKSWHLRSVLSKSMRCTENYDTYSWHWSTERAQFFSMTSLDHTSHNHTSKAEPFGLRSFPSSSIFIWPLAKQLQLLQASQQLFAEKMLP